MTSISQNSPYLPHTIDTRYHAVLTYRNDASVNFICRIKSFSHALEITWIQNCIRRNPKATLIEIFYKLKTKKGYDRHLSSLFRVLRKLGFFKEKLKKKKK